MSTDTLSDDTDEPGFVEARYPGWVRILLASGAVIALLLLGVIAGLLVTLPGDAEVPAAGSVDVGFAQDMSVHHLQAVQIGSWERDHTADPALRQFAFDIESTQTNQVGQMQGWLTLWGQPLQGSGGYMAWMAGPGGHGGHGAAGAAASPSSPSSPSSLSLPSGGIARMPGMASDAELAHLRALSGTALDVDFLQLMLRHHEGGSAMLAYAAQHASQPAVRALASGMLTSQASEADYLRTLLAQRGAAPLPGG